MTINIGTTNDPVNKIRKTFTSGLTLTGTLKDSCNIDMPEITIQTNPASVAAFNYMYIPEFQRYYYITDRIIENNNLVTISGESDPLMSFANQILSLSAVIARGESAWNLYLNDPDFQVYQNPIVQQKKFPIGFTPNSFYYVLAVNGNGGHVIS